jgi:hypothetical protein
MGEKKIWKEDPLEKTGAKTHKKKTPKKSNSPKEDPRGQHFSRPTAGET